MDLHRMSRCGAEELLLPGILELDRPASLDRGKGANIFRHHFLLRAKTAADKLAEHTHTVRIEAEEIAQLCLGKERGLRGGADVQTLIFIDPRDCAVCLKMSMLGAVRRIGRFVDDIRLRESGFDIADAAVEFEQDVSARTLDTGLRTLVVENWCTDAHRFLSIEDGRQQLIVHLQTAASLLRSPHAVR